MKSNLSSAILQLLNEQIAHELYNSNLYKKIGSYLKNIGLDNIGDHFYDDQTKEEHSHADKITSFLVDRNEKVELLSIPEVNIEFTDIIQIAELYVVQEQLTTSYLTKIASQSLIENDYITFGFMQEMINYQRVEESESITFRDRALMTQNDYKTVLIWDANFK